MCPETDDSSQQPREVECGDIVTDRDQTDRDSRAVVVNVPPVEASDWDVRSREVTLAEDNPSYPADAQVVVVVFIDGDDSQLDYYTGTGPIRLTYLEERQINFYAFPRPRLRKCGSRGPFEIELDTVQPSPYHSHTFHEDQNEQFIWEINDRGYPKPAPLVRVTDDSFVLINGHRRVWASHVSELSSIKVNGCYMSDEQTAQIWARCHLSEYTDEEYHAAVDRLQQEFGDEYAEIIDESLLR